MQILKWIGRFLIYCVMGIPWVAILLLLTRSDNKWVQLVGYAIPFFCWLFTVTWIYDSVCLRLKLYDSKQEVK